jgi:quinol monooxygenase YgiN
MKRGVEAFLLSNCSNMIKRIVKMTFRPDAVQAFVDDVFGPGKERIRAFPGCRHMELVQSVEQPNVLFTLSYWDGEDALAAYRRSEFFQDTWAKTKALFAEKPEAWSVVVLDSPPA